MTRAQARTALIVITLIWGVSIAGQGLLGYAAPHVGGGTVRARSTVLCPRSAVSPACRWGLVIGVIFGAGVAFQNLGLAHTTRAARRSSWRFRAAHPGTGRADPGSQAVGGPGRAAPRGNGGRLPADGAGRPLANQSRRPAHPGCVGVYAGQIVAWATTRPGHRRSGFSGCSSL